MFASQAGSINHDDALITLQLVLAKVESKDLQPRHMAWESLASCIALLADTSPAALKARARCGFSHRQAFCLLSAAARSHGQKVRIWKEQSSAVCRPLVLVLCSATAALRV